MNFNRQDIIDSLNAVAHLNQCATILREFDRGAAISITDASYPNGAHVFTDRDSLARFLEQEFRWVEEDEGIQSANTTMGEFLKKADPS